MYSKLTLIAAILALGLSAAGDSMAANKTTTAEPKQSNWGRCTQICKKAYGPMANVHHIQTKNGKPFCWCVM